MPEPTRRAAAITRALRDLTTGRLATAAVEQPCTTGGGFRVTTTTLLARQLDDDPNGATLIKRRVAAVMDWDPQYVGVYINPQRATIDVVLAGQPASPASEEPDDSSGLIPAVADLGRSGSTRCRRAGMAAVDLTAPGRGGAVATLATLATWWRGLDRRPTWLEVRTSHEIVAARCPMGYRLGHQAQSDTGAVGVAYYTLEALVPKATYAPVATFSCLADALGVLADQALPRARRRTASHAQIQQALAGVIARHAGTPTIFDIAAAA